MANRSEKRTLLLSVLMSAPGPAILALALGPAPGSTQVADLVRRCAELLALILAFGAYLLAEGRAGARRTALKQRANRFTGAVMCLSGAIMLALALAGPAQGGSDPAASLAIAALGLLANSLFWRKYTALDRAAPDPVMAVQARLYRAKAAVDGCVTAALLAVWLLPGSAIALWLDKAGSAAVALYLCACGARTLWENR